MALGHIILLDMPKKTFTLSDEVTDMLADLKDRLDTKSQTATIELALRHLHRTVELEEPVHFGRSRPKPQKSA